MKTESPMQKVLACFHSQTQLALEIGVSVTMVNKMLKTGKVPPGRAAQIEMLVDGKVTKQELCPDFPWPKQNGVEAK